MNFFCLFGENKKDAGGDDQVVFFFIWPLKLNSLCGLQEYIQISLYHAF